MSNLTISVDEELIRKARVRAIQEGTSVSAKLREYLQHYVNGAPDPQARQRENATDALLAAIEAARLHANPDPLPPRTSVARCATTGTQATSVPTPAKC